MGNRNRSMGIDEEFMDKIRNIEENVERNYKGPFMNDTDNINTYNDPKGNLNELKGILGS